MKIYIMDVEHGNCTAVRTPSGHWLMIDCGHNGTTNWRPSNWLMANELNLHILIVSNLDEDHVTDLPNIAEHCEPDRFRTNPNLDPNWVFLEKRKIGGPGPGVAQAIEYMRRYTGTAQPIDYGIRCQYFYNHPNEFTDFNNLSIVTFLELSEFCIIFPGDLERDGGRVLLRNSSFNEWLGRVNVFVVSHHGRENGYCEEVFDLCEPDVFVISDKSIQHGTQEGMSQRYRGKARGIDYDGAPRRVLTTRNDGAMYIEVGSDGSFVINPFR